MEINILSIMDALSSESFDSLESSIQLSNELEESMQMGIESYNHEQEIFKDNIDGLIDRNEAVGSMEEFMLIQNGLEINSLEAYHDMMLNGIITDSVINKMDGSNVSIEAAGGHLKNIVQTIINFFQQIFTSIANFFKGVFQFTTKKITEFKNRPIIMESKGTGIDEGLLQQLIDSLNNEMEKFTTFIGAFMASFDTDKLKSHYTDEKWLSGVSFTSVSPFNTKFNKGNNIISTLSSFIDYIGMANDTVSKARAGTMASLYKIADNANRSISSATESAGGEEGEKKAPASAKFTLPESFKVPETNGCKELLNAVKDLCANVKNPQAEFTSLNVCKILGISDTAQELSTLVKKTENVLSKQKGFWDKEMKVIQKNSSMNSNNQYFLIVSNKEVAIVKALLAGFNISMDNVKLLLQCMTYCLTRINVATLKVNVDNKYDELKNSATSYKEKIVNTANNAIANAKTAASNASNTINTQTTN